MRGSWGVGERTSFSQKVWLGTESGGGHPAGGLGFVFQVMALWYITGTADVNGSIEAHNRVETWKGQRDWFKNMG